MSQGAATLSDETSSYLAELKKGKQRRFVMVAKGNNIISLIVYKKGSLDKLKKEAKESGKGQFYFGVVEGSGPTIIFKLAIADGFADAPVKNTVLKSFLTECGFKCIPEFAIVSTLPDIAEDDLATETASDSSASAATQPAAERVANAETSSKTKSDSDSDSAKYKSQLTQFMDKLVPVIKRVLAVAPERKEELLQPIAGVRVLLASDQISSKQFEESKGALLAIGVLLKQLTAGGQQSNEATAGSQANADAEANSTERSKITEQQHEEGGDNPPLREWKDLRGRVIDNLKRLASLIAATKDPKAATAIKELKVVIGNLTVEINTQSKSELLQYLSSDAVVDDICRFAFDFRTPMTMQINLIATEN